MTELNNAVAEFITEGSEEYLKELAINPKVYTTEELITLMLFKSQNIKTHMHPEVFLQVANKLLTLVHSEETVEDI